MYLLYCAAFTLVTLTSADKWCCDTPANFEAKMAEIVARNNHNNDSTVDLSDVQYYLAKYFDKNHDTKVSKVEFVLARECLYGDSVAFGEFVFDLADGDKDGFIDASDSGKTPLPLTVAAFEAGVRLRYKMFSNGHGSPVGK